MKKVKAIKINKIWGYEKWLYSNIKDFETSIDGAKTLSGPLIKIIQANEPLSIQVHPDDQLANQLEGQPNGKSESWYVLEAQTGSSIIVGLKDYDKENIMKMIANNVFEKNLLTKEVQVGDFINVPAGMIHGLGKNIKVLEVQQPSDTTYRYYDYNRIENGKLRELHIEKALISQKKLSYLLEPEKSSHLKYTNSVGSQTYCKQPTTLDEKAIIVDLKKEVAYEAQAGEKIILEHYCIVTYL